MAHITSPEPKNRFKGDFLAGVVLKPGAGAAAPAPKAPTKTAPEAKARGVGPKGSGFIGLRDGDLKPKPRGLGVIEVYDGIEGFKFRNDLAAPAP